MPENSATSALHFQPLLHKRAEDSENWRACTALIFLVFSSLLFCSLVWFPKGTKLQRLRCSPNYSQNSSHNNIATQWSISAKTDREGEVSKRWEVRFLCLPFNLARERCGTGASTGTSRQKRSPFVCHMVLARWPTCGQQTAGQSAHLRPAARSAKQEENLGNQWLRERRGTNPQEAKLLPRGTTSLVFCFNQLCGQPNLFLHF